MDDIENDEIFKDYLEKMSKNPLKNLSQEIIIDAIFDLLKQQKDYVIIGGEAFNIYVQKDYKIVTGDIDIKIIKSDIKDFYKWLEIFFNELKEKLKDYSLQNMDIKILPDIPIFQLLFKNTPILDFVYYSTTIPFNTINGLNYAKPKFLMDQLSEFKGFAAGAGLKSKEFRRLKEKKFYLTL